MGISAKTTAVELAALVSLALEASGIPATLSGGGAVSIYTQNLYQSKDLDFVSSERRDRLAEALSPLGFELASDRRHFAHPATSLYVEFPPDLLQFGNKDVSHKDVPVMETEWGPLRVITATHSVMDRLAAYWHWNDRQSWDQAVLVARHASIDYEELLSYAKGGGVDVADVTRLQAEAASHGRSNNSLHSDTWRLPLFASVPVVAVIGA